jgi:hypothetical protein
MVSRCHCGELTRKIGASSAHNTLVYWLTAPADPHLTALRPYWPPRFLQCEAISIDKCMNKGRRRSTDATKLLVQYSVEQLIYYSCIGRENLAEASSRSKSNTLSFMYTVVDLVIEYICIHDITAWVQVPASILQGPNICSQHVNVETEAQETRVCIK